MSETHVHHENPTPVFGYLFGVTAVSSTALALVILVVDAFTPLGVTVAALYVIPVILSVLADDRRLTVILTVLCACLTGLGFFLSPPSTVGLRIVILDRLIVILVLVVSAALSFEMTKAKRHIRELGRLLTICAWTKQIKVGERWLSIEEYLTQHLKLRLSHGISQEAAEKLSKEWGKEVK